MKKSHYLCAILLVLSGVNWAQQPSATLSTGAHRTHSYIPAPIMVKISGVVTAASTVDITKLAAAGPVSTLN